MWAHYADGHKGLCLEFDANNVPFRNVDKVNYKTEYPDIDWPELIIKKSLDEYKKTYQMNK